MLVVLNDDEERVITVVNDEEDESNMKGPLELYVKGHIGARIVISFP